MYINFEMSRINEDKSIPNKVIGTVSGRRVELEYSRGDFFSIVDSDSGELQGRLLSYYHYLL